MSTKTFKFFIILLPLMLPALLLSAQQDRKYVRDGNKAYEEGDYKAAEAAYRAGINEKGGSNEANFNLGTALYQLGEYESAAAQFELLQQSGLAPEELAKAYHNLGNSLLEQQKYQESIQAYRQALRNNPNDADARYNLVYAMKKLAEQQDGQQQQNDQNQEQDQNQDQNQQQDQQNNQNQENEEQQENSQNQQEQNQEQEQQQNQEQQQQAQDKMTREEAEQLLQALQGEEDQLHESKKKPKKAKVQQLKIVKDW